MLPVSSAPTGYVETNIFYLRSDEQLPRNLTPDAHFTYGEHETWTHLFRDIAENTCGLLPCHVLGVAVWAQDDLMDANDEADDSDDPADHPPAVPSEATSTDLVPAAAIPDAATTAPVPPHPAALPIGPVRQVLPPELQHQLEMNLNTALQPVVQHLRRMGLTEADAVNEARSLAWHHLHNMGGLTSRHTKTRRTGTSESSRGWY